MNRRTIPRTMRTLTAVALVAGLAACADDGDDGRYDQDRYQEQDQGGDGPSRSDGAIGTDGAAPASDDEIDAGTIPDDAAASSPAGGTGSDDAAAAPASGLDEDEVAGLLWMREEEQLAHDVYRVLGDRWGLRIFENIAASEQTHIEVMVGLLDRFGLADPAAGNEPGSFTDPRLQQLYDDLVDQGMASREEALVVGATIEELDIDDLRRRADATDEQAIVDAYARLERASRNHLRAFAGQLDVLGVPYEPTVLDDFDEIVAGPMERGGSG